MLVRHLVSRNMRYKKTQYPNKVYNFNKTSIIYILKIKKIYHHPSMTLPRTLHGISKFITTFLGKPDFLKAFKVCYPRKHHWFDVRKGIRAACSNQTPLR